MCVFAFTNLGCFEDRTASFVNYLLRDRAVAKKAGDGYTFRKAVDWLERNGHQFRYEWSPRDTGRGYWMVYVGITCDEDVGTMLIMRLPELRKYLEGSRKLTHT